MIATTEGNKNKRKRRPAGTPDPDAEVVSLSPKTLLESDRYVCEICKQGFQRDQNLQMHRRRHKVPWKLLKRDKDNPNSVLRKRVFVCPEPSCLHHHPSHALGDLVGIKKHFRRKHSNHKQWVCHKCCKAYAVQSDFKAHLKTCGTRGHSCDCGRVFSRVESFIEHQDACNMEIKTQTAAETGTGSSPSTPSTGTNFSSVPIPPNVTPYHNLELKLSTNTNINHDNDNDESNNHNSTCTSSTSTSTRLQLSIGSSSQTQLHNLKSVEEEEEEEGGRVRMAVAEKSYAEEARQEAKRQIELAEREFSNAKRMRRQAQVELDKATALKQQAIKQINSTIQQITCQACQKQFQPIPDPSLPFSVITTEAELSNPTPTPTP